MLGLEPLLRDRLAAIPDLLGVYGLPELNATAGFKMTPCAFVVFDGYRVLESSPHKRSARLETRWLVVLSVRHASQTLDGAPARSRLAPLVEAVLARLLGWRAGAEYTPLALADAPAPLFEAGALLFPLAFTAGQVVSGDD